MIIIKTPRTVVEQLNHIIDKNANDDSLVEIQVSPIEFAVLKYHIENGNVEGRLVNAVIGFRDVLIRNNNNDTRIPTHHEDQEIALNLGLLNEVNYEIHESVLA